MVYPPWSWAPGALRLQLHRQLVDLGRQDEVVLRQPADGVGGELDGDAAVAGQVQVGAVVLALGKFPDPAEEVKAAGEVLDEPFAADVLAVRTQLPARDGPQVRAQRLALQPGHPRLTGPAAPARQ